MNKISDYKFAEAQDQKVKIMIYQHETNDNWRNRTRQHVLQDEILFRNELEFQ